MAKVKAKQQKNFQPVNPEREGAFTAKAKKAGMAVQEFADYVMAHTDKFDATTVKQANFARVAKKWKKK